MTNNTQTAPQAAAKFVTVVFGLDENGKPKGARFGADQAQQALQAAQSLKLEIYEASTDELRELAKKLPSGRIYAQGRAFIPFIKRELYDKVRAASQGHVRDGTAPQPDAPPLETIQQPAKSKTQKPTAKTVVMFGLDKDRKPHAARFTDESDALLAKAAAAMGLRLAVPVTKQHFEIVNKLPAGVIHATGNGVVPNVDQKLYDQINALVGGEPGVISASLPKSWTQLAPGHLVIAQDTVADGWWEALITKRSGDTLTLKWRDYPSQSEFIRPIRAVALLKTD